MSLRFAFLGALTLLYSALAFDARASAQELQVDADLTQQSSFGMSMPAPSVRVGINLSDRLTLQTGLTLHTDLDHKQADYSYRGYQVPLEATWYFRDAAAHSLVPSLRLAGSYGLQKQGSLYSDERGTYSHEQKSRWLGASILGGVTYFVSEHFGISTQAGPIYRYVSRGPTPPGWYGNELAKHTLAVEYRLGFLFRT